MVAGIYKPIRGAIWFDDRLMNHVPPKDRNIGMVFQSYALCPYMIVYENHTFPMKLKKTPKEEMQKRAQRVADMMGIGGLIDRKPGGAVGRTAAARGPGTRPGQRARLAAL